MKVLGGLVTSVIVLLLGYYLNHLKSPDVRYQLSSPITVEAATGMPPKLVQQIEIANSGSATAQRVQVRMQKSVGTITLSKDSEGDKSEQLKIPSGGTELDYEALRAGGRIKISLVGGDPLTDGDLEVRSQDGLAKRALASENPIWSLFKVILIVSPMILYWVWLIREMVRDTFRSRCRLHPIDVLEMKKPLLLSRAQWEESLREEAVTHAVTREAGETGDVPSWHIYRLLNTGMPEHLPGDIWAKVLPGLIEAFVSRLASVAQASDRWPNPTEIGKLLTIQKPRTVFDESWNRSRKDLGYRFCTAVVTSTISANFRNPGPIFETAKADGLERERQEALENWLSSLYFATIVRRIQGSWQPMDAFGKEELDFLSKSDLEILKEFAYGLQMKKVLMPSSEPRATQFLADGKPAFMTDNDFDRFEGLAKAVLEANNDKRRNSAFLAEIRHLLAGDGLGSVMPPEVDPDGWARLKKMEDEIVTARNKNEQKCAELIKQENETATLKAKLLRQLDLINTFINDPAVVDRIEEYDGVFAPGNLVNLRRLAEQLRSLRSKN